MQSEGEGAGKPEQVSINADSAGSVRGLARLEAIQQVGLYLAIGVGCMMTAVILLLLVDLAIKSPSLPPALVQMEPEKARVVIDNIKILNDLAVDRSVKLFDTIVTRSLLPVFTAILGYIFGSRSEVNKNA